MYSCNNKTQDGQYTVESPFGAIHFNDHLIEPCKWV